MKAVLPLLLCLTLLAGCMPVSAYAALPEVLAERVEGSSVSEIAEENLVLKLFPLEDGQDLQWLLHADVDAAAQDLLGQDLERLTEALPLLCLSMQLAREGGLEDVEADQIAERFQAALPQCASCSRRRSPKRWTDGFFSRRKASPAGPPASNWILRRPPKA